MRIRSASQTAVRNSLSSLGSTMVTTIACNNPKRQLPPDVETVNERSELSLKCVMANVARWHGRTSVWEERDHNGHVYQVDGLCQRPHCWGVPSIIPLVRIRRRGSQLGAKLWRAVMGALVACHRRRTESKCCQALRSFDGSGQSR